MSSPSTLTIKKLSILSGNKCAFPKCSMSLVDEDSGSITAQICHIKAKNSGGPRYDSKQTNQERDSFENLILMCPIHHKIIDDDEESYTVKRLQQIKSEHETLNSESVEQGKLEELLESYLSSIIKEGKFQTDLSKSIQEENLSLIKAQKLAKQKTHNERRKQWLYSHDGLVDGINSVKEVFSLIQNRISTNSEIYTTLGIELNEDNKNLRIIYNYNFGCQVELKGFHEINSPDIQANNSLANIELKIVLFKKRPTRQGSFYTDAITQIFLVPDLTINQEIVWRNKDDASMFFSAEGVCEKLFDLLIDQIEKKEALHKDYIGKDYLGEIDNTDEEDDNWWDI